MGNDIGWRVWVCKIVGWLAGLATCWLVGWNGVAWVTDLFFFSFFLSLNRAQ